MLKHGEKEECCREFKWGTKRNVGQHTNNQFYESFTYKGSQYSLYDCVYFYRIGDLETSIGKLVNIFETPTHEKKLNVVWFFRPIEICQLLENVEPLWNELFLACGEGAGLSNVNPLEAVIGKCNVICTSQDKRNPQPSKEEVRGADYIFYRTFDVKKCTISDIFKDKIGGIKVEHYFNRKNGKSLGQSVSDKGKSEKIQICGKLAKPGLQGAGIGVRGDQGCISSENTSRPKIYSNKDNRIDDEVQFNIRRDFLPLNASDVHPIKKRKCPVENMHINMKKQTTSRSSMESNELLKDKVHRLENELFEVTRRPSEEKKSWLKEQPWEEKIRRAEIEGTLVLLENLDPSYTSSDVEDIIWSSLHENVEARMIQQRLVSSPYYGKAFAIFKSKDKAESAIFNLFKRYLMLPDGRPLIARKGFINKLGENASFPGHIAIGRLRSHQQRQDMRDAVSTSHCSQPNTIEYDMAMEWRTLQARSDSWWKELHQEQAKERENTKKQLMSCFRK